MRKIIDYITASKNIPQHMIVDMSLVDRDLAFSAAFVALFGVEQKTNTSYITLADKI